MKNDPFYNLDTLIIVINRKLQTIYQLSENKGCKN